VATPGLSISTPSIAFGQDFALTAAEGDSFPEELEITLTAGNGQVWTVLFQASCSYALEVGDAYGTQNPLEVGTLTPLQQLIVEGRETGDAPSACLECDLTRVWSCRVAPGCAAYQHPELLFRRPHYHPESDHDSNSHPTPNWCPERIFPPAISARGANRRWMRCERNDWVLPFW
jgi:hypothetical protein